MGRRLDRSSQSINIGLQRSSLSEVELLQIRYPGKRLDPVRIKKQVSSVVSHLAVFKWDLQSLAPDIWVQVNWYYSPKEAEEKIQGL